MLSCRPEAEHPLEINSKLVVSLRRQKVWSTRQILKIEIIFNLKQKNSMNDQMGLKPTLAISNFKAGNVSMPT